MKEEIFPVLTAERKIENDRQQTSDLEAGKTRSESTVFVGAINSCTVNHDNRPFSCVSNSEGREAGKHEQTDGTFANRKSFFFAFSGKFLFRLSSTGFMLFFFLLSQVSRHSGKNPWIHLSVVKHRSNSRS